MRVGVLRVRLRLQSPNSLKDKRSLLKHLIAQLQGKFNASVAEVDHQDAHRTATLGVAVVANDTPFLHRTLGRIASEIERASDCSVEESHIEVW